MLLYLVSTQLHTLLTVVVGLASTPLLLTWLGPERFGLQRVLEAWSQVLGAGTQSILIAAGIALVPALARGERGGIDRLLAAAGLTLLISAAVSALVGLALSPLLPWLAPAPGDLGRERFWFWVLAWLPSFVVVVPLCKSLFEADQRGYRVNLSQTAAALGTTGTALLLAWFGCGLVGQAVATLAGTLAQAGLLLWWVRCDFAWLRPWTFDPATLRTLWRSAAGLLLLAVLGTVGSRAEQVWVNYFGGPAAVASFLLTQRLFALGALQLAALSAATWAPLGDLYHRGDLEGFRRRVADCQRLVVALAFAGGLPLLAHTRDFLRLWVGEEQYGGDVLCLAFTLALPAVGLQALHGWLLAATGHASRTLPGVALYNLTAVMLGALLGWAYGPPGVAWGVLLATGVVLLSFNLRTIHRHLSIPWHELLAPGLRPALLAAPVGLAAVALARTQEPGGWLELAVRMLAIVAVYLMLWWWLALPAEERSRWRHHLSRLLNRAG